MDLFDILTLIISVAGLVGVIYQSINLQKTINSQIYQNFVANSLEIDRILIEYPHLRKYVYYGEKVDENTEELERLMSLVELIVDVSENVEVYRKYIPKARKKGWFRFINDVKNTSAYDFYMKRHQHWYETEQ